MNEYSFLRYFYRFETGERPGRDRPSRFDFPVKLLYNFKEKFIYSYTI